MLMKELWLFADFLGSSHVPQRVNPLIGICAQSVGCCSKTTKRIEQLQYSKGIFFCAGLRICELLFCAQTTDNPKLNVQDALQWH